MIADYDKAVAELPILRRFIDFINMQVGVYMDCLSGFTGNIVRTERQVHRMQVPIARKIENGQEVIVWNSLEDPSKPDIIHNRIIRANEFIAVNSEGAFNEQQVCWAIIVFIYTFWDDEIRPQIAKIRGVEKDDVKLDVFGDLRLVRRAIIHDKGALSENDHKKLKKMAALFEPGEKVSLSHDQMHKLFIHLKQGIAELILKYTGHLPGAPRAEDLTNIAIQNPPKPGKRY